MRVYVRDDTGREVVGTNVSLPEGLTVRQMAVLLDDSLVETWGWYLETCRKSFRRVGRVGVLDAERVDGSSVHLYFAPEDVDEAETEAFELARLEAQPRVVERGEELVCPVCQIYEDAEKQSADTIDSLRAEVARLREEREALLVSNADDIRSRGWSVAVHNDYRLDGKGHTFWLFTHPQDGWIKGEGRTDAEALSNVRTILAALEGK